jgi:purine-nucleoside phosphorylase
MSRLYDPELRRQLLDAGARRGVELREGVYVAVTGPSFETPAEVRAFGLLGGDAVGMSTAPEAIVARHEGMKVAGVSCVCNLAAGLSDRALSHQEVLDASKAVGESFERVVREFVRGLEV